MVFFQYVLFGLVLFCVKCDFLNPILSEKLNKVACFLSCDRVNNKTEGQQQDLRPACSCDNPFKIDWTTVEIRNLSRPDFLCKDEAQLHFGNIEKDIVIISEIRSEDSDWQFYGVHGKRPVLSFNALEPERTYEIRIYGMELDDSDKFILYGPSPAQQETTWALNYTPLPVKDLFLLDMDLKDNLYFITVEWIPAEDNACYYDFVWFSTTYEMDDYKQIEIHQPQIKNNVIIDELQYGSNYSVAIMAKSANWREESPKEWLHFTTPTCLLQHESLDMCPPMPPQGLEVVETVVWFSEEKSEPTYDLDISWEKPELIPLYYTLYVMVLNEDPNRIDPIFNLSGNTTSFHVSSVELGIHYQITLTASSLGGTSYPSLVYREIVPTNGSLVNSWPTYTNWTVFNIILIVFGPVFVLMLTAIFGCVAFKRYRKRRRIGKVSKTFKNKLQKIEQCNPHYLETVLIQYQESPVLEKWEIKPEQLVLQTILGHGAFGIVRKGWMTTGQYTTEVAIKMLKEYASGEDIRQFRQEIEIMASVGSHPHIVSMLGCCTKSENAGPYLVVEFCSRGDLQSYLRNSWEKLVNQNIQISACEDADTDESGKEFANKLYDFYGEDDDILQPADLLSIARQIALGMEHLSNMHVLHRDLAARNVLVCSDRTVKVSDFGLSRDVYQDNVYCKRSGGKLPVRWMALESLSHQVYTAQTDIWSYGILLWEIVTLGGNPYPGICTENLVAYLQNGYRMERPDNCNVELYDIMISCWRATPKERPSFMDLRIKFDKMLESLTPYLHLDINNCSIFGSRLTEKPNERGTSLMNRYVKPSKII